MPKTNKGKAGLVTEVQCSAPLSVSLTDSELYDLKTEFVWFFNGENNAQPLLAQRNNRFLDELYSRYCSEISKMREHYGLDEIISEAEYAHNWFKDWKRMELLTKDQFLEKAKLNEEFALIWADLGVTDSLEFRQWGLTIKFSPDDEASVRNTGTDQLTQLVNSIISNPERGFHFATLYNPSNVKERTIPLNLVSVQFVCKEMSYAERVGWFFENYYETGMEMGILMKGMESEDLDKFKWHDEFISIPKFHISLHAYYGTIENQKAFDRASVFCTFFLKTTASILNMVPSGLFIISPQNHCKRMRSTQDKVDIVVRRQKADGIKIDNKDIRLERISENPK